MSSKLKALDLTSAGVGFKGTIDFSAFSKFNPMHMQDKAHIWLFNESGAGTDLLFNASNNSHYLPAGAWGTFDLEPNDSSITVTVTYLLPNPPVSTLNAIYYAPGEKVPTAFTLGNSPIGIGGSVNTSSVQTLSNETNAANTLVVDIGDTALANLWQIFTDHFTVKVDQSGVAHAVLRGQTSGIPLLIGQAGDIAEAEGQFQTLGLLKSFAGLEVDGTSALIGDVTLSAHLILANNVPIRSNDSGSVVRDILYVDGANITTLQAALLNGAINIKNQDGTSYFTLSKGRIGTAADGDILDANGATTTYIKARSAGQINFQTPNGTTQASINSVGLVFPSGNGWQGATGDVMARVGSFSGTGSGTYTHNLGATPDFVTIIPHVAGSATIGYDSETSTQVHITLGASLAFFAFCSKRS